ncbi:DUF1972 domain-containing protein [Aeromicrobium duanguangcaii]|uniref:DUF1972 domain-containing protein n=1 Tax=Aeromicrobium duanguangcaii TaxID=2968086 RepID=A0ABY5KH02_9ACTN|nr:DUF1972 domain-containing protein [Aeromicrobium duanguangcaii]MCD9155441.1 DUF1972 domain-containing protein [Aeromicrobium duanguangcaii]UUI69120.1 DUF1972 domain-containing protein [Aeromicrobium duanguangcaii]
MRRSVRILGTHGVPGNYGGFETAAENVALHLVDQGWDVIVYCQVDEGDGITEDTWRGMTRVKIPLPDRSWKGTSRFDLISIRHAARFDDLCLTFGYNTAIFNTWQRLKGIPNVINMDGIEWSRSRWGKAKQAILWINERIACYVGNHLIADHPEIATYLRTRAKDRKITTITYGAATVTEADPAIPAEHGLTPGTYLTLIARPIPENSILELVEGFSRRDRGVDLAILGAYDRSDPYHAQVLDAAGPRVRFLGPIYAPEQVQALRFHSRGYLHGHTVGGTNPSLVEAMGCGNPIVAHDNVYNRWVAQDAALYFRTGDDVDAALGTLLDSPERAGELARNARDRHRQEFTWAHVAGQYESLLEQFLPRVGGRRRLGRSGV